MKNLISRAQSGDAEALIALMEQNKATMYRIAVSILRNDADAADAVSETVFKCWREIKSLKTAKYFNTWLTRILINNCKDIIRKNSRTVYVDSYEGIEPMDENNDNSEIDECFSGLSDNYRLIMLLHYKQGFKIKEIARMLGIKENTVKTRLSRGRQQFRDYYTKGVTL